jgi:hypothetical protein
MSIRGQDQVMSLHSNRIINVADGTGANDATNLSQLNTKLNLNGTNSMTANLNVGGNRIFGLADATNPNNATTKQQMDTADALKLNLAGGTMTGNLDMGINDIINVDNFILNGGGGMYADAANTTFFKPFGTTGLTEIFNFTNSAGTQTTMFIRAQQRIMELLGEVKMNSNKITGLANGTNVGDAVNKGQMDTADALKLDLAGGSMLGVLNMNNRDLVMKSSLAGDSNEITWKSTGADTNRILTIGNGNLVMYSQLGTFFALSGTGCYTNKDLNMSSNKIINVEPGTNGTDAVNLNQLNASAVKYSDSFKATLVNFTPLIVGTFTFDNIPSKASSRAFLIDGFLNCSYTNLTDAPIGISYTCDYFNSADVLISDEDAGFTYGTSLTIGSTYYFNLPSQDIITDPALCVKVVVKFRTSTSSGNVVSKNGRAILTIKDLVGL